MRRIGDRFVVGEPLGAGGMGSIHRGHDERLGHAVAIKLLKRSMLEDPVLRERFRREALSLAKLRHPGIVTVLDAGEDGGDLYTVLELVTGETLEDRMKREPAMHLPSAAAIMDQILAALEACHDAGIVHRDIKPSNVMIAAVNGADHVKLIDFGLARIAVAGRPGKLTETGAVQGTPHYMAPEQCRGEDVGPASDVYSTGILFYELLAGALPFHGADAATFMAQHLFVDPTPLRNVAPHLSAGIAAAVHSALAKDPDDRPTARALRHALASAVMGTDPQSLADTAAAERVRVSALGRHERAITGCPPSTASEAHASGTVVVWMKAKDRAAAVRSSLGAAGVGIGTTHWTSDEPEASFAPDDVAIVVSARDGLERVRRLRAIDTKVPIVVVDVKTPDETTAAIRAGASDMLLAAAPDADLASKIRRLARRRVRR